MLFGSRRSRLLLLFVGSITLSLVMTLFPMLAVHAATGFTTQARLGFPATRKLQLTRSMEKLSGLRTCKTINPR